MSILEKALKALKIPASLKDAVTQVLAIKPDKLIVCGFNTEKRHVVTAGAGDLGTQDALTMLSSGLASVYMELPKEFQGDFPIDQYLTSVNTMILQAVRQRMPEVLASSTVPVETVEPQLAPVIIPDDEDVKVGSADMPIGIQSEQPVPVEEYPEPEPVPPANRTIHRKGVMKAPTKPAEPAAKRTRAKKGAAK